MATVVGHGDRQLGQPRAIRRRRARRVRRRRSWLGAALRLAERPARRETRGADHECVDLGRRPVRAFGRRGVTPMVRSDHRRAAVIGLAVDAALGGTSRAPCMHATRVPMCHAVFIAPCAGLSVGHLRPPPDARPLREAPRKSRRAGRCQRRSGVQSPLLPFQDHVEGELEHARPRRWWRGRRRRREGAQFSALVRTPVRSSLCPSCCLIILSRPFVRDARRY